MTEEKISNILKPSIENGLMTFLKTFRENKACKALIEYIENDYTHPNAIDTDLVGLGLAANDPTMLTYVTRSKIADINDIVRRTKKKPARAFNAIFGDKMVAASELEDLAHIFKSMELNYKISLHFDGTATKYAYLEDNYERDSRGTLWDSCMRHKQSQKYVEDFYSYNDDTIGIVIAANKDNKVMARALVWKFIDQVTKQETLVMDRIYTSRESLFVILKNWAKSNGVRYMKAAQSAGVDYAFIDLTTNQELFKKMYVPIKIKENGKFPYLDTFQYLCFDKLLVTNDGRASNNIARLITTTGEYEGYDPHEGMRWCEIDEDYYPEDEVIYCESGNYEYVHQNYARRIANRDVWVSEGANVVELYNGNFAFTEDVTKLTLGTHTGSYCLSTGDALYEKIKYKLGVETVEILAPKTMINEVIFLGKKMKILVSDLEKVKAIEEQEKARMSKELDKIYKSSNNVINEDLKNEIIKDYECFDFVTKAIKIEGIFHDTELTDNEIAERIIQCFN